MNELNVINLEDTIDDNIPQNDEDTSKGNDESSASESTNDTDDNREDNQEGNEDGNNEPTSSIYQYLKNHGISDPSKIQFENEDGTIDEQDFNSLSPEEQLEILNEISDPGITNEEFETINYLRRNRMSLKQAMETYARQQLDAYLNEHPEDVHTRTYSIDDYSDDDLYIVNLKKQYPDFTDDELLSKLDEAKKNEELYKRETEALRNTYKAQEDEAIAEQEARRQQQVEDLHKTLMESANNFNEVQMDYKDDSSDSIVVEDSDKQIMMSYLLDADENGKTQLVKDLEDPNALIELAWLRTQGADALSNLTQYWKGLLTEERAKNKKLESQIEKMNKKEDPNTVITPSPKKNQTADAFGWKSAWGNEDLL